MTVETRQSKLWGNHVACVTWVATAAGTVVDKMVVRVDVRAGMAAAETAAAMTFLRTFGD